VSRLTELLAQAKAKDPQLGADLEREFKILSARRAFGLNFERHRPEAAELPQTPVRRGDKVRLLPSRGSGNKGDQRLWRVTAVQGTGEERAAKIQALGADTPETCRVPVADLVVVAEFRDLIYPGLVSTGRVERGGDKPCHTVINGENYLALRALTYTHRGRIDAIYIDPPYNTGAKDWKYNNDYVEADDAYRHSKWLAMMERRLKLAKELLNPARSILIVTIDEKEVNRLGLLLEQMFPNARAQLVTIVINAPGQSRDQQLARVDEYAFFLFFGEARAVAGPDDLLNEKTSHNPAVVRWESLLRSGTNSRRADRPALFYPIYTDSATNRVIGVGESKELAVPRDAWEVPAGARAIWPLKSDGSEGNWRASQKYLIDLLSQGYARIGSIREDEGRGTVWYLGKSAISKISTGEFRVVGKHDCGAVLVEPAKDTKPRTVIPKTVWSRPSHHAGWHGSAMVRAQLPGRSFPFPKSLYAVEDALRIAVGNSHRAVILDFFAGSGTTAHAVMRLNRQDGGRRQCILVTNNEVGADEQKALRAQGLRPGDPEWEQQGICEHITKPRVQAVITGCTPEGEPIQGDYKFTDQFPMAEGFAENAEFFTLTFENSVAVDHNLAFARIAPLLWLRAGSEGRRIDALPEAGFALADTYALLADLDAVAPFCAAVAAAPGLRIAYIVTDDAGRFQAVARCLPAGVEPLRLYESYLTNFQFANGD